VAAEGADRPPGVLRPVRQDVYLVLVFAFLGGLLLNVMPCVFPVIGLKIMGFAKQAHKDRRAIFIHGLAYTAGVLICFWTLSFLVITMGRGWGAQLQSEWFLFALCHVFVIMSMNMAGVFDIGASAAQAGQAAAAHEGVKRSFLTGLLATITSTPCSAPFLGTALAYALSLPALLSLGVFTLMGLGFAFPYLALSLFPNWLKKLPKPGQWMDTFRQAMCFPLFATTAYLFWTMEAMMGEWQFLMLLFGLVLTAMACWLYGRSQRAGARSRRAGRTVLSLAGVSLLAGLWLGMPRGSSELQWQEWSPEAVSRLREEGRPVYVDFTARWCATCQVNKRVYLDQAVVDLIKSKNVALLKADWTLYDERITSTLKNEFNKAAVPVTVLYAPGKRRASVLPDILTSGNVGEALATLP
jgi:thiol:disulfide interchange protein